MCTLWRTPQLGHAVQPPQPAVTLHTHIHTTWRKRQQSHQRASQTLVTQTVVTHTETALQPHGACVSSSRVRHSVLNPVNVQRQIAEGDCRSSPKEAEHESLQCHVSLSALSQLSLGSCRSRLQQQNPTPTAGEGEGAKKWRLLEGTTAGLIGRAGVCGKRTIYAGCLCMQGTRPFCTRCLWLQETTPSAQDVFENNKDTAKHTAKGSIHRQT
jgi:hypothetical protein